MKTEIIDVFEYMFPGNPDRRITHSAQEGIKITNGADVKYFVPQVIDYDGEYTINEYTQATFERKFSLIKIS